MPGRAPSDGERSEYGWQTVGIPGTVAALTMATERYGSKTLAELVQPAIELAADGFILPEDEASRMAEVGERLVEFESSARYFLKPNGMPLQGGERLVQADLARTLRAVAEDGANGFYGGWVADSMAAGMRRHGGFVTLADLAAYRAEASLVVRGSYRSWDLAGTYLPASGATTIEALQILEHLELGGRAGTAEWAALTAQALLLSFADRELDLGTPAEQARTLTSKDWAAARAAEVEDPAVVAVIARRDRVLGPTESEPAYTSHLSAADADGWLVALTQSIGPMMGSKVAAPGLGFVYAATMGYLGTLPPGTRAWSSMSPLMVIGEDGSSLVLGAAGARRIISALVEVVSRMADQELSLADAMAAPRFHPTPDSIYLEDRDQAAWSLSDIADLTSFGFAPAQRSAPRYFARIHGIAFDPATRQFLGVADPRWGGSAGAPRR